MHQWYFIFVDFASCPSTVSGKGRLEAQKISERVCSRAYQSISLHLRLNRSEDIARVRECATYWRVLAQNTHVRRDYCCSRTQFCVCVCACVSIFKR